MALEIRKVQRVGYSTLTVSLPSEWAKEAGIRPGSLVSIKKEDDGSLRIIPGVEEREERPVRCVINADLSDKRELLSRVITGSYIVGHETMEVYSKGDLKPLHLEEIRRTVQRLTGLSIVQQTLKRVLVQSFLDPTKFPVIGLLRRMEMIIKSMHEAAIRGLVEVNADLASQVSLMEEEVDRIYCLVVRQLLLALRDRTVAPKLEISSPLHVAGNRVVAKTLEEMADLIEGIAKEALWLSQNHADYASHTAIIEMLSDYDKRVQGVLEKMMKAFFKIDLFLANEALEEAEGLKEAQRKLIEMIQSEVKEAPLAASFRTIVSNLSQLTRLSKILGEIAINRYLEEPSEICAFERA